jgi:hypothetical protein
VSFPEWLAYWECLDCGATWCSEIPPEGFHDIPDEPGRRVFVQEFLNKDHRHDCGMFGNGRARITQLMRSAGSFGLPTTPKEVPNGLVGN